MSHDYRSQMLETRSVLLLATFLTVGTVGPWSNAAGQLVWQALPDMPIGKWEAATAVIDGKLYVAGGSLDGGSVEARMWVTDAP